MKARIYTSFGLGLALAALPFVGGCTEQSADLPSSLIASANAEPTVAALNTNAPAETPTPPPAETELASAEDVDANVVVPAPAAASEKKLPANLKPTGPTAEVAKLAQAGVDEMVMLNYITNATSLFVLSSDDIIYLNDLGVAGPVVTAMMQHDQGLKAASANQAAQPPQVPTQAAAPTYVNPPQPEPQPQPQPAPVETAPPPAANVTYNYFNDSLAPYGTWVDVEGYGRCWQPTVVVVNSGWRPYCDRGRWIYSDCGWYWLSDYSWGATTFHYGRWFSHPRWGWCWWPDRVWGPSWVSWRFSGDYCGWAPLLPTVYIRPGIVLAVNSPVFVPTRHFNDPHPWRHRLPHHEEVRAFRETAAIENIRHDRGRFINPGIAPERISAVTKTEIRKVSIRETATVSGAGVRSERLEHDGRSLVVNRHRIPESAAANPLMAPPLRAETARDHGGQTAAPAVTPPTTVTRAPTVPSATTRVIGRAGQTEIARERSNRPGPTAPPQSGASASTRTAPASPPPAVTSSPANPPPKENRGTPRTREERPANPNRAPASPTPAPASAPNKQPTASAPAAQMAPPKSLVVIGRREANPGRDRNADNERLASATHTESPASAPHTTRNWTAPTAPAPAQQYAAPQRIQPSAAPSYTPPTTQPPRVVHQENRYTPSQPNYTPPRQNAPAPVYVAPPRQTAPAPAPRSYPSAPAYSAPPPAPAPVYTPPPSRSQNNETRSAPERSSSGRNTRPN